MKKINKLVAGLLVTTLFATPLGAQTPTESENPEVQDTLDKAALARSSGDFTQAIQLYEEALKREPDNFILHRNLGVLYYEAGDFLAAGKSLLEAQHLKPNDPLTLLYEGKVMILLDDAAGARQYLEQSLEIDPKNPAVYLALGDMHRKLREFQEASENYQQAQQLAPQDPAVFSGLGHLFYDTQRFDLAAQNFEESLKYSPENGDTWYNLGMSYFALNDLNKAAECMHRSLGYKPNNAETFNALGLIFERAVLWDLAEKSFRKALEIDPSYAPARNNLEDLQWKIRDSAPPLFSSPDIGASPYGSQVHTQRIGPVTVTTLAPRPSGFSRNTVPASDATGSGSLFSNSFTRTSSNPFDPMNHRRPPGFDMASGYDPQTGYADTAPPDATDALVALGTALLGGLFKKGSSDQKK